MARVLRNSKGQYAGSTKGWGAGRSGRGGGLASGKKGRTKKLRSIQQTRANIRTGVSIGVGVASAAGSVGLIKSASRSGNMNTVVAAGAVTLLSRVAFAAAAGSAASSPRSRKVLKRGR